MMFASALDAATAVRTREISSRELTEQLFARIDAVNPALNAVVEQRREAALVEAATADEAIARGDTIGPVHGVPMTVKECFDVAGMHTTWGNPAFADFVADRDATVVERLRNAGAIVAGKTNVAMMLADFAQTSNEVHGTTNNPWDVTRTPGGSSGGATAAVAAGLTFADYGTDLVGSIRIPAAFCGVYGLRPSADTVPLTDLQPPGVSPELSEHLYLSTAGPLARSAADLRALLRITAGPDDPAYTWTLPAPRHRRLADFRVGVVLDDPGVPVTSAVGGRLSAVADAIAAAGATVVEGWPDGVDPGEVAESFGFHVNVFFAYTSGPIAEMPDFAEVVAQERRRMAVRAAWARYFADVDVFVCPVTFTAAFPHDPRPFDERRIGDRPYLEVPFWTAHPALPGLPAVAAPAGRTPDGLPVGVQIIGPRHEEDTAITFAELLADVVGGYERPTG